MTGRTARKYHTAQTHVIAKTITFADMGNLVTIGEVPDCFITRILAIKAVDFNGTTPVLDIGTTYYDGTTADPDGLVSDADLSDSVALGPTALSFVDNVLAIHSGGSITASPATGGSTTTGEITIIVEFIPSDFAG